MWSLLTYPITIRTITVMACVQDIRVHIYVTIEAVLLGTVDVFLLFDVTWSSIIWDNVQ